MVRDIAHGLFITHQRGREELVWHFGILIWDYPANFSWNSHYPMNQLNQMISRHLAIIRAAGPPGRSEQWTEPSPPQPFRRQFWLHWPIFSSKKALNLTESYRTAPCTAWHSAWQPNCPPRCTSRSSCEEALFRRHLYPARARAAICTCFREYI